MAAENQDYSRHSPDRLLEVFSRGRLLIWVIVAVAAHVLMTVATSTGYIRDHYLDPDGAALRKAAAAGAEKTKKAGAKTNAVARTAAATGAVATASAATTNLSVPVGGEAIPADRAGAPAVKRITEVARPDEMPSKPGDLGISLEDTRVR